SCLWNVNAGASTAVNLLGGRGPDTVEGIPDNHIAAGASSTYELGGGAGDDLIDFTYANDAVDGTLGVILNGGEGNDMITANLIDTMVGPTGRVMLRANGGAGNDFLSGDIRPCIMPGGMMNVAL